MRLRYLMSASILILASLVLPASQAGAATYDIVDGVDTSIYGTITTNGTIGALSASDITSYNISFAGGWGGPGPGVGLAIFSLEGSALTATATGLFFDFSANAESYLVFSYPQDNLNGTPPNPIVTGTYVSYCDAGNSCILPGNPSGTAIGQPSTIRWAWVAQGCCATGNTFSETGNVEIASYASGYLAPSTTPLPSTWLMMLSGFVGLGFFAYRGTKKNAAALAA